MFAKLRKIRIIQIQSRLIDKNFKKGTTPYTGIVPTLYLCSANKQGTTLAKIVKKNSWSASLQTNNNPLTAGEFNKLSKMKNRIYHEHFK